MQTYIYIYIYIEREREGGGGGERASGRAVWESTDNKNTLINLPKEQVHIGLFAWGLTRTSINRIHVLLL